MAGLTDTGRKVGRSATTLSRFNGAAVSRPRILREQVPALRSGCRFNGAAVSRPRIPGLYMPPLLTWYWLQWGRGLATTDTAARKLYWNNGMVLQWGRNLTTTDTLTHMEKVPAPDAPSMGPRSNDHGTGRRTKGASSTPARFNGAAVLQPRIRCTVAARIRLGYEASMGPRSHDHGYLAAVAPTGSPITCFKGAAVSPTTDTGRA
jgi:hypothetical protein